MMNSCTMHDAERSKKNHRAMERGRAEFGHGSNDCLGVPNLARNVVLIDERFLQEHM